jgi:hypothetical protein
MRYQLEIHYSDDYEGLSQPFASFDDAIKVARGWAQHRQDYVPTQVTLTRHGENRKEVVYARTVPALWATDITEGQTRT